MMRAAPGRTLAANYEYLAARDRIQTAEDFISRAATQSSWTGEPYEVRCTGGSLVTSNEWLGQELARYRACRAGSPPCAAGPTLVPARRD